MTTLSALLRISSYKTGVYDEAVSEASCWIGRLSICGRERFGFANTTVSFYFLACSHIVLLFFVSASCIIHRHARKDDARLNVRVRFYEVEHFFGRRIGFQKTRDMWRDLSWRMARDRNIGHIINFVFNGSVGLLLDFLLFWDTRFKPLCYA